MKSKLSEAADELEQHSHVDNVRREPDGLEDVVFVTLDWVTDSHQSEGGTQIIESKQYDGHIEKVCDAIRDLDSVHKSRMMDKGLYARTVVVKPGTRGF